MAKKDELLTVRVFWLPIIKEIHYSGKARSVTSFNRLGEFDILPGHSNFITLIFNSVSIITENGEKIGYQFKSGVLEVRKNVVNIFLGI